MANTFGTFLELSNTLREAGPVKSKSSDQDQAILAIGTALDPEQGTSLSHLNQAVSLPKDVFIGAVLTGREKGLFEIDDSTDDPVIKITKLGRSFMT